jgi:hypothetical protein
MLTMDDDNLRDALATSVAVVCLVGELLMQRRPEGDLCLSCEAASGLTDVLMLARTALMKAKNRLSETTSDETPP